MFKKNLVSMLVMASLCAQAQSGPLGRAIKATQVILSPTNVSTYLDWTTNFVLQGVIEDFDAKFTDVDATFMPGTNIASATYDPATLTWVGLGKGDMPGTNIASATYDPATLTWGGLGKGDMPGTNIFFSIYAETNKTWTPVQYHADSYFFWAGNNGGNVGGTTPIITEGAALTKNSMHDYIAATNIFSDAGGWMDLSTGVVTLPVAGLYDVRYSCAATGAPVMLGYIRNGGPGAIPYAGGYGGWTSTPGKGVGSLWAGYDAFQAGDEIEFVYFPSVNLSSTVYVSQFFIYVRLVGPFPTGDFMSFKEFNEQ